jgi:hypothetical protein
MNTVSTIAPLALVAGLVAALPASAASLISADTAIASSEFSSGYVAENTINGTGLSMGFDQNSLHDTYVFGNHWTTTSSGGAGQSGPVDEFITWGFDTPVALSGMYIWNHLSNNIAANAGYEPVRFSLRGADAQDNEVFFFDDLPLLAQEELGQFGESQLVGFGSLFDGISTITFTVLETQSSTSFTGLAEVIFTDDVTVIPVPGAGVLLLSGLLGLGLKRRRVR